MTIHEIRIYYMTGVGNINFNPAFYIFITKYINKSAAFKLEIIPLQIRIVF